MIIGLYGSGKSTFVNSILRRSLTKLYKNKKKLPI